MTPPNPSDVTAARLRALLTQSRAAALIHTARRTWQDWESGKAKMHPGLWELFLIKTLL